MTILREFYPFIATNSAYMTDSLNTCSFEPAVPSIRLR